MQIADLLLIRRKGIRRNLIDATNLHNTANDLNRSFVAVLITHGDDGAGIRTEPLAVDWATFPREGRYLNQAQLPSTVFLQGQGKPGAAFFHRHQIERVSVYAESSNDGLGQAGPDELLEIRPGDGESLQGALVPSFKSVEDLPDQVRWRPGRFGKTNGSGNDH